MGVTEQGEMELVGGRKGGREKEGEGKKIDGEGRRERGCCQGLPVEAAS